MQHAQLRNLPVGRVRRWLEPLVVEGKLHHAMEAELGGIAQARQAIGGHFQVGNQELARAELLGLLAGAIGDQHEILRCLVVKHLHHQSRPGLWSRLHQPLVLREMAPDDFPCVGGRPPSGGHQNRLEATDLTRPCGSACRIAANWAGVISPSSAS